MSPHPQVQPRPARVLPARLALDIVDVFVYLVVLNLFIQFVPEVLSESFTLSLFTAVLMKAVLEVVVALKDRLKGRFKAATNARGKVVSALGLWLVLVGSKFVVIELVAVLFGDSVSVGGFWSVTALILTLVVARDLVRRFVQPPLDQS